MTLKPPVRRDEQSPLQNRVSPFGELCAFCARGLFMGNRGGRFHTDAKTLTARRWASRQWICCVLDFKGRRRDVWGRFYTELFFLDEPTALAAGHRPCFECRRKDAETFAEKWREARRLSRPPHAPEMDDILHARTPTRWRQALASTRHRRVARRRICRIRRGRPSASAAVHSPCGGRRKGPVVASRGRAVSLSMCSPRRRSWLSCQVAVKPRWHLSAKD